MNVYGYESLQISFGGKKFAIEGSPWKPTVACRGSLTTSQLAEIDRAARWRRLWKR